MEKTAEIEEIELYLNPTYHQAGYYATMKVETKLKREESAWKTCKGVYSVTGNIDPHEVRCDELTTAKFIRISVDNFLALLEVKVTGIPIKGRIFDSQQWNVQGKMKVKSK